MRANRAAKSTESSTEAVEPPMPTTPEGSDTKTASVRSTEMRAVGKWSSGEVRNGVIRG